MLILKAESMNKYSTKRTSSNCNNFESSFSKHRRDYSPSRRSHSRNSSPDSWSPRGPSSYSSKSYSQRSKERDRDTKYYDGASKSKYMRLSRSRSPVGHEPPRSYKNSSGHSRDSYYENNHSSSYSSTTTKRPHFGYWTEEVSSSGKRYYYNTKTEMSQWEKPRDWLDWERRHTSSKYSSSDKYSTTNYRDKYDSSNNNSSNPKSYAYSNDSYSSSKDRGKDPYSSRHMSPNYRSHNSKTRDSEKRTLSSSFSEVLINKKPKHGDNSTSDNYSYKKPEPPACPLKSTDSQCNILNNNTTTTTNNNNNNSHTHKPNDQRDSPKPISIVANSSSNSVNNNNNHHSSGNKPTVDYVNSTGTPSSSSSSLPDSNQYAGLLKTLASIVSSGQNSLNLTKLLAQLTTIPGVNLPNSTPEETLLFLKKAINVTQKSQQQQFSTNNNQVHATNSRHTLNSPRNSTPISHQATNSPTSQSKHQPNANKNYPVSTYRHLNSADGIRQDLDQLSKNMIQSPTSSGPESKSSLSSSRNESAASTGLSTISSVMSSTAAQKSTVPNLSRFKHLFREDCISHVSGWNSEQIEKQAAMLSDQANHSMNHQCTRVSAELKNARSYVRLTEIFTTLQKQRILFAGQQIKTIEEWKGKQFSNYS